MINILGWVLFGVTVGSFVGGVISIARTPMNQPGSVAADRLEPVFWVSFYLLIVYGLLRIAFWFVHNFLGSS